MVTEYQKNYKVAVIGATGNAGFQTLNVLAEKDFPISEIYAVASENSKGKNISFGKKGILKTQTIDEINFEKIDLAFFSAGSDVSRKYVESAIKSGTTVIDKTSFFRYFKKVPLIVPEVNESVLLKGSDVGVVSNPNCVAIPLSMTLKAINNISKIKRVIVSTYQAVSGAGHKGNLELMTESEDILNKIKLQTENFNKKIENSHNGTIIKDFSKNIPDALIENEKNQNNMTIKMFDKNAYQISDIKDRNKFFKKQIAFNVIPSIDDARIGGITGEEEKISNEILKILGNHVKVFVTCVRVPVIRGHSMSVVVETEEEISPKDAYEAFTKFQGIVVVDNLENHEYITPVETINEDVVFVSRIRRDVTAKNSIAFWASCDNLRKGAALNGVQIAKSMIKIDPSLEIFKFKEKPDFIFY